MKTLLLVSKWAHLWHRHRNCHAFDDSTLFLDLLSLSSPEMLRMWLPLHHYDQRICSAQGTTFPNLASSRLQVSSQKNLQAHWSPQSWVLERSKVRKAVTGEKRSGLFTNFFLSLNNRTVLQILDSDLALQVTITQEQLEKGSHQAKWIPLLLTSGHRDNVWPQENMQSTCRFISNLDVHVNLGVGPGFLHWWFSLKEEKQSFFHESRRWLSMSRPPPPSAWKKASEKGMRTSDAVATQLNNKLERSRFKSSC